MSAFGGRLELVLIGFDESHQIPLRIANPGDRHLGTRHGRNGHGDRCPSVNSTIEVHLRIIDLDIDNYGGAWLGIRSSDCAADPLVGL